MHRRNFLKGSLAIGTVAIADPVSAQTRFLTLQDFIRIKFCSGVPCKRRNVYTLLNQNPNHPTIAAYRNAIASMKALPDNDPISWAYQANIHGTNLPFNQWPSGAPFETCQHGSQHFFSWHRMYLAFFERIIRKHSYSPKFCLPYWNYEKSAQAALPTPFRSPANNSNSLWNGTRNSSVNNGASISPGSSTTALNQTSFLGSGQFQSTLEGTPHGTVHVAIGGNMGNFAGAGRDPIFWLHHCNIDRLWEKWLSMGGGRTNPIGNSTWMNQTYTFVDENGQFVTMTVSDVLDTVSKLNYQYDDPAVCVPLYLVQLPLYRIRQEFFKKTYFLIPLAQNLKIDLEKRNTVIHLDDQERAEELSKFVNRKSIGTFAKKNRIVLKFVGIQTENQMDGFFEAYVNFGSPSEMSVKDSIYVGNVATFGADRQSRESMMRKMKREGKEAEGQMHGVTASIDITEAIVKLAANVSTELNTISVTLVPSTGVEGDDREFSREIQPVIGEIRVEIVPNTIADQ